MTGCGLSVQDDGMGIALYFNMINMTKLSVALRLLSGGVILIGALALTGWVLDIQALKTVIPGLVSMKGNTAICFGTALFTMSLIVLFTSLVWWTARALDRLEGERREAQEAQAWLASFLQRNPSPIAEVNVETGVVRYVNPAAAKLFPDLQQRGLAHVWLAGVKEIAKGAVAGGAEVADREIGLEGRWYTQVIGAMPGTDCVRVYGMDITQRKQAEEALRISARKNAEEALRESEARFRTLADNMSQFAWMADEKGWIFWYNKRWLDYTGTTLEEMQGWGWRKVHHPEHVQRVVDKISHCFQTGGAWEDTFPLRGRDGQYRWFLSRAMPIRNEQGKVVRWFGTNTDITERKRNEEELTAANRELEAFGYSVSHDLRAPLRHIDSYINLLARNVGPSLDQKSQKQLRIVVEAARRMGNLIDDLLVLSRLGRTAMEEQPVNLRRLLDEVRQELAPAMAGRAIEWRVGPLPRVQGDPNLLRSAMTNLLSNAIKYSRERNPGRIEVGSREQDGELICFVRDNGAGFDMRFVDKLFGVFQRLHRAKDFEGTGIGLASVRRVIQRHGGRTWAEGELGKGATFYFSLPLSRLANE